MTVPADHTPDTRPPDATGGDDEQRLSSLIEQWALLRDQGRDVTVGELCRDCPHLAPALAEQITLLARFDAPAPAALAATEPPVADFAGLRYRPLRFHARGGLGVVFVARDGEVGRDVALKRISERRRHLAGDRQRFLREAEITGRLEHPGVVPLYSVGHDASGQPYYTMRFVEGRTLADALAARRHGDAAHNLRALLGRFVAVRNTLGYAHSRGVIHRDLKPGNILLGDYGETLVIDWGLARRLDSAEVAPSPGREARSEETAAGATQTGREMGTAGFMSPEQARGDWARVGPGSDVFSLGATLYAILTGRAPYAGPAALHDARQAQFPRPRQAARDVPAALEAVCLKAMAAAPEGRYAGALELGADVQRWLDDEPVTARREPLLQRLGRWGRRHKVLVATAGALLVACVVGLSLGLWAVGREQARTAGALADAETNLGRALMAEKSAKDNLQQAEANLVLARRAIDECYNAATEHPLFQGPRMEKARRLLLEKTLPFYKNFSAQRPDDPALQFEEARQWFRVASIEMVLGRLTESRRAAARARDMLQQLARDNPGEAEYQARLASAHRGLSHALLAAGRHDDAVAEAKAARDLQRRVVTARFGAPDELASLATMYAELGSLLESREACAAALAEYLRALDIQQRLVRTHPNEPRYQLTLAVTRRDLGGALDALGRRDEALSELDQAVGLLEQLVRAHPGEAEYRNMLAGTRHNRANLFATRGRPQPALADYRRARELQSELAAAHPDVPEYHYTLAVMHNGQAALLAGLDRGEEALREHRRAGALAARLVMSHPDVPEYRAIQAHTHHNLGTLQARLGRPEQALAEQRRANAIVRELIDTYGDVPRYQNLLALTHLHIGDLLERRRKPEEALRQHQRARDLFAGLMTSEPGVPGHKVNLARTRQSLGEALARGGKPPQALRESLAARTAYTELAIGSSGKPEHVEPLARVCINTGWLIALTGRPRTGLAELDRGLNLVALLRDRDPGNERLVELRRFGLSARFAILMRLGRPAEALADWGRALALRPVGRRAALLLQRARDFVTPAGPKPRAGESEPR